MSEKLPKGWNAKKIVELNKYKSRNVDPAKAPSELFELYSVPSFPLDTPELLTGNQIKSTKQRVEPGDVLLCKINPRINRVWVVASKAKHKQIASSEWIVFRNIDIDPHFAKYFFSSPTFREKLCEDVSGVGGSLTRARPQIVSKLSVAYPSLDEQKRIVARLDQLLARVDNCRAHLDRAAAAIKRFRQSVVNNLISSFKGSKKTTLSAICKSIADGDHQAPPKSEAGIPFLVISNLMSGKVDLQSVTRYVPEAYYKSLNASRIPQKSDILYTVTGSYGKAVIVENDARFCFQRHIAILKPDPAKTDHTFLLYQLNSPKIFNQATETATGVAQMTVPLKKLREFTVELPNLEEQKRIAKKINSLFGIADHLESRLNAARERVDNLTASILAKAFRGELLSKSV